MIAADGACEGDVETFVGCRSAIPPCPSSNGQTAVGLKLFCVKMGAFEITCNQNSTGAPPCTGGATWSGLACGKFLGAATVTNGSGSADTADNNSVVVIELVQ